MYLEEKLRGIRLALEEGRGELTDTEVKVMRMTFEEEVLNLESLRAAHPDEVGRELVEQARRITELLRGFEDDQSELTGAA